MKAWKANRGICFVKAGYSTLIEPNTARIRRERQDKTGLDRGRSSRIPPLVRTSHSYGHGDVNRLSTVRNSGPIISHIFTKSYSLLGRDVNRVQL